MLNDLLYTLRGLRRSATFTVVAVVTLALAIGSATAVFSVVDAVVVHGLPYGNAGGLWTVYQRSEDGNGRVPSFPTFSDWQRAAASVRDVIEGFAFVRGDAVFVGDSPEKQTGSYVTPGFFQLMETQPLIGRTFRPDEEGAGGAPVAVLSYDFFMRRFGGDRAIVGKSVAVDSVPTTIIGVMPRGFAFPNYGGPGVWIAPALWQPIGVYEATHTTLSLRGLHVDSRAILRLRSGADSARAAAAMRTIARRIAATYPADEAHWTSVVLQPLQKELFGELWSTLELVSGAIALVLLLACASVANLLLIRGSVRRQELALRAALGAEAWRLSRQPLLEAGVIGVSGGLVGFGLAVLALRLAKPFVNERLPFASHIVLDPRVVLFAACATVLTVALVGGLAASRASRPQLIERLRGGASSKESAGDMALRNALVAAQFALAITLLVGAGLLIQSVRRLANVPLDYDPRGLVTFYVSPPVHRYDSPAEAEALYKRILDAVRAVPSIERVAAAGGALIDTKVDLPGRAASAASPLALYHPISSDYLATMGVRVVAGRGFSEDDMESPNGLLVTDTLAKHLWPKGNAVGQRITIYRQSQARADFGQPISMPVVGVVADFRAFGRESGPPEQVFLPYTLEVWPWMNFVARARTSSPSVLKAVEKAVRSVEPGVTFYSSLDRSERLPSFDDPRMFVTGLLSVFGATALLLAAVGLYGVVAYAVAQRTREIGIRIAIGATPGHVVRLLLRQAASFVVGGIGIGLFVAWGATRVLRALLFQTGAVDVETFVIVPVVLGVVAVVASCVSAVRAARTDPTVVMRAE